MGLHHGEEQHVVKGQPPPKKKRNLTPHDIPTFPWKSMVDSNVFPHWNSPVFWGCKHTEVLGASFEQLTISQWISGIRFPSSRGLRTSDCLGAWPSHKIIFATQFCVTILTEHWLVHKHGRTETSSKGLSHHLPAKNSAPKTGWCKFLTCSDHLGSGRMAIQAACECSSRYPPARKGFASNLWKKSEKRSRGCSSPPFSK